MATYYRWRKSTISKALGLEKTCYDNQVITDSINHNNYIYISNSYEISGDEITLTGDVDSEIVGTVNEKEIFSTIWYTWNSSTRDRVFRSKSGSAFIFHGTNEPYGDLFVRSGVVDVYKAVDAPGTSQGYVYSLSSSAYPTNGVQNSYYYNNRTTITSPTNPSQLSYPSLINQQLITLSWNASTSEVPDYPIQSYELFYSTDSGSQWQVIGTTSQTTYEFGVPNPYVDKIRFRVRAMDSNSQFSDYLEGTDSTIDLGEVELPVLTLPQNVKLGANITISWNSIESATNYILQRKTIDNEEWTQVYSGPNLSCFNLIDALGISYRIAFNVGSNYTSPWSQEYRLSSYEKIIEMSYLDSDGNYMPLYPRTITNAVVNSSDLIQTTMLTGKYTGNGMENNEVVLANNIEPKVGFLYDSNGNVTGSVGFNDEGNLVVDKNLGFNENGSEYGYVVIGEKSNNDFE